MNKMMNTSYSFLFSVIIPTFNRLDEIRELLISFEKQILDISRFEVIIVDDGSTDKTDEFIVEYNQSHNLNIRFLKQNHKGPGEARNLGMEAALGEYLVFIDSDCIARYHATITLNNNKIFIADHSTNGTYLYIDNREIFLANESRQLVSGGYIVCGRTMPPNKSSSNIISYQLCGKLIH